MKSRLLPFILLIILSSCRKNEEIDTCRLEKFVQENPLSKSFHYDYLTLKDGRIEKLFSFDITVNKDTLNKAIVFFEYNSNGQVKAARDEANPARIKRYDASFDNKGNATRIVQTVNGGIEDEVEVKYDDRNRPIEIISRYLLGVNRSIEYDKQGNPSYIYRSDLGTNPTITLHTFDDKRNFFEGVQAIKFYWIIRPLNTFLPYGDHNIVSSKIYQFDRTEFKEAENLRTRRELTYNEKGFPETIKILREDLSSTVTNISTFAYNCQ
ncbi:hypothetical protein [Emticicia agri]|uniref:DUF4595 domain-containing protein n=1 Tax=Emticicia agri TaxID=2492393 RepID=A0A4Q5M1J5_9BACT|nr:hypothetical protein [Emticicia agri]RYU96101.1 hypothetical protein EWM59_07785 [Emticicia agri]